MKRVCMLNAGDTDAQVEIMIYFADRKPAGPFKITVPAQRTVHQRFNDLRDPETVPKGTTYSSVITSTVPIVAQHTRLDGRRNDLALLSTIAYSE